jgi:hypothetical protein
MESMQLLPLPIGPENPVRVLPPALLSKAVIAFERLQSCFECGAFHRSDILTLLAIVFDLSRNIFGRRLLGEVALYRDAREHTVLVAYGSLLLDPQFLGQRLRRISLRFAPIGDDCEEQHEWKDLRAAVQLSSENCIQSFQRIGPIIRAAREVLRNCPYSQFLEANDVTKWRFKIVRLVCAAETDDSVDALEREMKLHPRLLKIPGWCGGLILHPCCRLGNTRQLKLVLNALEDAGFRSRLSIEPPDLINWQNFDGCTPLRIAQLYEQDSCAELLLNAGANPKLHDRFTVE